MRIPATSYPAALTASRTRLRNATVSSICDGYDFASMVTKPVIARIRCFTGPAPRPGAIAAATTVRGAAKRRRRFFMYRSLRQRVWTQLEMRGERARALAALDQPWRTIAVGGPQSFALPPAVRIVDAAIETFGVE